MEEPGLAVSHVWTHTPCGLLCLVPFLRVVDSGSVPRVPCSCPWLGDAPLCGGPTVCIPLPVHGPLGCFHSEAIVSPAAMDTAGWLWCGHRFPFLLGGHPGVESLGQTDAPRLTFLRNHPSVFQSSRPTCFPSPVGPKFSSSLTALPRTRLSDSGRAGGVARCLVLVLIRISLTAKPQ